MSPCVGGIGLLEDNVARVAGRRDDEHLVAVDDGDSLAVVGDDAGASEVA